MRYRELTERYTADNAALLHYLRNGEQPDPYTVWFAICQMIKHSDEQDFILDELSSALGQEIDVDDLEEHEPEIFYHLPADIQKRLYDDAVQYEMENDPANAPTTAYLTLQQKNLLHRLTWLAHFSDNADDIAQTGFQYGVDEMDRLGLTVYLGKSAKSHPGYNFAFAAGSRYAINAAREGKYGRNAVLFQNSGVRCWHGSDEEEQIIFYGKDVNPGNIIYLRNNHGDWEVKPRVELRNRDYLFTGSYDKCVAWVIKNHQQYRRYL